MAEIVKDTINLLKESLKELNDELDAKENTMAIEINVKRNNNYIITVGELLKALENVDKKAAIAIQGEFTDSKENHYHLNSSVRLTTIILM